MDAELKKVKVKVKAVCPRCKQVSNVSKNSIGNKWGIDDVKCSLCFKNDMVFVNLQLTPFEKSKLQGKTS